MIGLMKMPKAKLTFTSFVPKPVIYLLATVLVLGGFLVGGGVAYTWYVGKNAPPAEPELKPEDFVKAKSNPLPVPTKPSPAAVVGVSVQSLTTPVKPGANAAITVKTNPEAKCSISVKYKDVPSTDSGLSQKVADEYGLVSWSWGVEESAPEGKWPVDVTCANAKNSGMVRGDLEVKLKLGG